MPFFARPEITETHKLTARTAHLLDGYWNQKFEHSEKNLQTKQDKTHPPNGLRLLDSATLPFGHVKKQNLPVIILHGHNWKWTHEWTPLCSLGNQTKKQLVGGLLRMTQGVSNAAWRAQTPEMIYVPIAVSLGNYAVSQAKKPFTSTVGIHEIP